MTLSSFSVTVPSQNDYKLAKISLETSRITLQKRQIFWKPICFWKTLSSKVDLIWHLRPTRKVENARTLIFFLSCFLQKLDFYDNRRIFTSCFLSQPQLSLKKHFSIGSHLGFISWRIYSLVRRVRHSSKTESKNDLLNKKCPKCNFSWEMTES